MSQDVAIPYGRQTIDDDDIQAVVDVLKGDWLTTGSDGRALRAGSRRVRRRPPRGGVHATRPPASTAHARRPGWVPATRWQRRR